LIPIATAALSTHADISCNRLAALVSRTVESERNERGADGFASFGGGAMTVVNCAGSACAVAATAITASNTYREEDTVPPELLT
jgi:hypothetical protein